MNQKWILLFAVLALSACQSKKPQVVAVVPAPEVVALVPAPVLAEEPAPVAPATVVEPAVPVVVAPVVATQPVVPANPVVVAPVVKPIPKVTASAPVAAVTKPVTAPVVAKVAGLTDAEALALAKKKNCLACHAVDKKVVGPAWKDVAAKNRGDAGAQAKLEAKIAKGGSGAWGAMPMPAQPQVAAEERTQLVRFILNLK
ncbi:MAG: c-type cytochrome [Sideroxydans sp.]|nr:c-type cytochrome [Sideroxydans sp.]